MKRNLLKIAVIALITLFSATTFAQVKTAGSLTFTFTPPKHASGNYETNGRYALAVWIESCTTCGSGTTVGTSAFVRTKMIYWSGANGNTRDHLPTWVSKSSSSTTNATSGATMGTGSSTPTSASYPYSIANAFLPKTITWDGTNAAGTTALADGNYRVCIQETWGHGSATATRYFPFTKGTTTDSQTPTADTNFTNISLVWKPTLATDSFSLTPEAVIYPNPTNGIFNIDVKNAVNSIKVINLLGEEVYNENLSNENAGTTKIVDLTRFVNGMYIVSLTNEVGTSNYKVILNK
jgi:hypothetical protein